MTISSSSTSTWKAELGARHFVLNLTPDASPLVKAKQRLSPDQDIGEPATATATAIVAAALSAAEADLEQARTKAHQERRVMGEHGEIAFGARHHYLLDFRRHEKALRQDGSNLKVSGTLSGLGGAVLGLGDRLLDGAHHVEGGLDPSA